jgi:CDP-paratose synthetase
MTKNTVLITGINGFLGSHLAESLSKEFDIVGLGHSDIISPRLAGFNFEVLYSLSEVKTFYKKTKIFAIIHTATVYRKNEYSVEDFILTNVLLPVQLYELAIQNRTKIFFNTDSFFNDPNWNYSYLKDYTLSKNQALKWLKYLNEDNGCKLINMKIFHMYGPYDAPNKFIPSVIEKLKNNESSIDTTNGEQTRDFIYVSDVVDTYKLLLGKETKLSKYSEFDIGTGKEFSIKDTILLIKDITNSSTKINFGKLPYRENELMKSKANIGGLLNLGWKPKFELRDGIKNILDSEE